MGLKVHLVTERRPLRRHHLFLKLPGPPRMRVSQVAGLQSPELRPRGWPCIISTGKRLSVLEEETLNSRDPVSAVIQVREPGSQVSWKGGDCGCFRDPSL